MDLIPGFEVPDAVVRDLERDKSVGVDLAVEQVLRLKESRAVDGVQLVPARSYRPVAQALESAGLQKHGPVVSLDLLHSIPIVAERYVTPHTAVMLCGSYRAPSRP